MNSPGHFVMRCFTVFALLSAAFMPAVAQESPHQAVPHQAVPPQQDGAPSQDVATKQETPPTQDMLPKQAALQKQTVPPNQDVAPTQEAPPTQDMLPKQAALPKQTTPPNQDVEPKQEAPPDQAAVPNQAVSPKQEALAQPDAPKARRQPKWEDRFDQANQAHDGHLTLDEAKTGYHTVARHFADIDVDGKGYVTVNDIRAWHALKHAGHARRPATDDPLRPRAAFQARSLVERHPLNTNTEQTVVTPADPPAPAPSLPQKDVQAMQ